ncbi:(Na+)-NQR maturation NqrM [Vibrio fluvialis]|uniref:(Na+)-NQR maturation NqrM n=1 Tax=Vibrio fluvialis TaxID=676 RepID=UPI001BB0B66B|nr:(Na+)-NQR maturation NqrM [Vibrio fluvialis]EKO3498996.1 (Na+)-NQR maturation NqrM [Vibrio fluvialis]EKO3944380.1 (Na+)-NQR maturation NqrM [Vibrio fluvialis]EKO3968637.1 (Na+)-NQR maturation NqrM [Vibrio fluvialis]EKZ9000058.1 (Na+)-NQR maturation NqrM [Vibrio fluvialis]ELI1828837.1 (Na+)-NQR maturation NqrM [Vibrio fluvialis]
MTYLFAFGLFLILVVLMSIGVLMRRKPIQGSCGGLSSVGVDKVCDCETICEEHQSKLYQIQEPTEKK